VLQKCSFFIVKKSIKKLEQLSSSNIYKVGAGGRTRTGTVLLPVDFESTTSAIPSHRQLRYSLYNI
jgi:hypothetical protein